MNVEVLHKKHVVLKITDEKWQGKKVNQKSVN